MHPQDTHAVPATLATTATAFAYLLALRRAVDELQPGRAVTIRVPSWFEAGGPWQLRRVGGRLPWRAARADRLPVAGQDSPASLALAFDDQCLAAAAVRMVGFDRAHPYVLEDSMWQVPALERRQLSCDEHVPHAEHLAFAGGAGGATQAVGSRA